MGKESSKGACGRCGRSFQPKVKWQEYCSDKCRMYGWLIKKLAEEGYKVVKVEE